MALSLDGTTGISATGSIISSAGIISATGNIYGGNIIGTIAPSAITVSGNATVGNLLTAGFVSATGTLTGSSHLGAVVSVTGNITGGNILTAGLLSLGGSSQAASYSASGNITGGNILTAGIVSVTGAITGGAITGSSLTVSTGNISGGNINNNNSNGVGNIGNSTAYFNTVFGKATTAQYADLAELYSTDAEYAPGTVLIFGGKNEVTISTTNADPRVAGVVSTNPAHLMNSVLESEHKVAVALQGRVPTSVTGTIRKGDMMVTAGNGFAQASASPVMGTVIGKALENFDGVSGTIEIVVGRL